MSLAMAVVLNDFIVTTSDEAVSQFFVDKELYYETGEMVRIGGAEATDKKSKKTFEISDSAFLLATGYSFITETLEVELKNQAKNSDDLNTLRSKAKKVMLDIKKGKIKSVSTITDNLVKDFDLDDYTEEDYLRDIQMMNFEDTRTLSAYLVGFNNDGTSGMVDLISNRYTKPGDGSYPVVLNGDVISAESFESYLKVLNLPTEKRTIENFVNVMAVIHAHISWSVNKTNVSSLCHFNILNKNDFGLERRVFSTDTLPMFDDFI